MKLVDTITALLDRAKSLLTEKEPVAAITVVAVAIAWLATHGAYALGIAHNQPPALDAIQAAVSAAVVALNLFLRQIVSSPATVAIIQATAASAGAQAAGSGQATVSATSAPAIATSVTVSDPPAETVTPTPDDPDPNAEAPIPEAAPEAVPADPAPAADAVTGTGDS